MLAAFVLALMLPFQFFSSFVGFLETSYNIFGKVRTTLIVLLF